MSTINKGDLRGTVWWALLESIPSRLSAKNKALVFESGDPCSVEVEFSMNGVSMDFEKVVDAWESQMDRLVISKAMALLDERSQQITEIVSDSVERVKWILEHGDSPGADQ